MGRTVRVLWLMGRGQGALGERGPENRTGRTARTSGRPDGITWRVEALWHSDRSVKRWDVGVMGEAGALGDGVERRRFLFLLGSARTGGNTEELARRAAVGLPADAEQEWVRLSEVPLPMFEDIRHVGNGSYPLPDGNARRLLDATLSATDLVIASPLYWYSVSTSTKLYLDHWSGWFHAPGSTSAGVWRARRCGP